VAATLALIFVGGLVTSHGAGLSVPDWPLSYGKLMPPMVGNVFYEHGHRMVASAVGLLTLVLAIWTARSEPRRAVRVLAWFALAAVVAQGILGGLTVLFLLPTPVSVAHACLAQAFFCIVIAIAYLTSPEGLGAGAAGPDRHGLRPAALGLTALVFLQLLLGALMRHTGAGLAIPDFPLAFGRLVPPLDDPRVAIHFSHRVGALAVLIASTWVYVRSRRSGDPRLARPALAVVLLVILQAALGAATVLSARSPLPTTAHVATGAAVLGASFFLTLRSFHWLSRAPAAAAAAHGAADPVPSA
jgi:heme a synthase